MLTIHQLEVTIEATTPLALDIYCGSALRGAFFRALWGRFCSNKEAITCAVCPLNTACPVSSLVAPLRDEAPRGQDLPRPYIITPDETEKTLYAPGEQYTFGFTLIGSASKLYHYLLRAFLEMERAPLGHPIKELQGKRGRFRLLKIDAVQVFAGQRVCLWQVSQTQPEKLPSGITADDVKKRASQCQKDDLTIHFLSPIRLVTGKQVLRKPDPTALILRAAQRLEQVVQEYGEKAASEEGFGYEWYQSLKARAIHLHLTRDETHWIDVYSYSHRQKQSISIGGFIGTASFSGLMADLCELLIWGELLRVGKNIVKGAGRYRIEV
jgi:hypothetical protein